MKKIYLGFITFITIFFNTPVFAQVHSAKNPVIFADVPDMSMVRVGDTYYMSSITMHMSPGVPIMKSKNLVNWQSVPLTQKTVYLKAECDFNDRADIGYFYYSLDEKSWISMGSQLKMEYSMPHFMGYRFGLFNYATKTPG
jgi:beta-xylosidase